MSLITKEVEICLSSNTIKYYEEKGYKIPRIKNVNYKMVVKRGTKILVKVEDLPNGSDTNVKVKCDCCGKEYESTYQRYLKQNHDNKTYCKECVGKVLFSGENNPNWKANKTQEEREQGRNYPEYTDFIKKVLIRDNYTCQCCEKNLMEM